MTVRMRFAAVLAAVTLFGGGLALAPAAGATGVHANSADSCALRTYTNPKIKYGIDIPKETLSVGVYNDFCVENLQWNIDSLYGTPFGANPTPLALDGDFGSQTKAWVQRFQAGYSCSGGVDGIAGPNTNSCLAHQLGDYW
jgi:peptidoglycan hydrolase-like protein with peptidoglycan-binding domain